MTAWRNLIHIFFTGPLLIYIGYTKPKNSNIYNFLLYIGLLLSLYFLYLITTLPVSQYHVWLMIHYIIFVPLLIYVGLKKTNTPSVVYSLLLAIGIAAFGFHSLRMIKSYMSQK